MALTLQRAGIYSLYVLFLLLLAYLFNQLDRYALAICTQPMAQEIHYGDQSCLSYTNVSNKIMGEVDCQKPTNKTEKECDSTFGTDNTTHVCYYDYNGNGAQYQILVGPVFIVIYTFTGIFLGYLADISNRKIILGICLAIWSTMTLLTGFATEYWHLVVLRFGLGIGEAGCTPFATSLIADYFAVEMRGSALGVYNWGIYIGYSLSYAIGDFITKADILGKGWRWTFWLAGAPGLILAVVIFLTLREPERRANVGEKDVRVNKYENASVLSKLFAVMKCFFNPSILMLCIAGSIRNGAGYVWGYNTQPYFNTYYPHVSTGKWFSWIPLVGGSIGVLFGGFISDRFVKTRGPVARIWVLIASLLLAAPFAAGTLFLEPPWAFAMQIPTYLFGEMWVSITLAVLVELVPSTMRASAVGFYFFIISNIGGNMPLLVPLISQWIGLRGALYILYPGSYVVAAVLFLLTIFMINRDIRKVQERQEETASLLNPDDTPRLIGETGESSSKQE